MLDLLALFDSGTLANGFMLGMALLVLVVIIALFAAKRYMRCPSNRVLVIYGKVGGGNTARCIHGGAKFVWPLIQDYSWLSLEPMQIEIPLRDALSMENIRVNVPSVFTVAVGTEPAVMQNAAIRLLGLSPALIMKQAQDIIFGQLRQVIASMKIEDINRDREAFLHNIQTSLEPELKKIGLVLINVNITDITDESGYIEAIGQKAASQAVQQARGDVAEQEKLGDIRVAEAQREKAVQVANANKSREIGMREASREQAVRVAELDKEQQIGEQTAARDKAVTIAELEKARKIAEQKAAFERDAQIKDSERAMRVAVADANAKAIAGEAKAQAEVVATQAELAVKQAEAYQLGETRKREAEAAVQEAQNRAMAKAALAEAERVEAERRAAVEAPAKAEKARIIVEAEAEAEKCRIEAEGAAAAIYAKLDAEARGQYEILAKKAEALEKIVKACGGAREAYQLMMLEHVDHIAMTAAQAIANIKFDKVVVWEGGGNGSLGNGSSATSNFLQSMTRTLPPMMQVMKDIGGIELPDYLVKLAAENGRPEATVTAVVEPPPATQAPKIDASTLEPEV
jgi:flotillin